MLNPIRCIFCLDVVPVYSDHLCTFRGPVYPSSLLPGYGGAYYVRRVEQKTTGEQEIVDLLYTIHITSTNLFRLI